MARIGYKQNPEYNLMYHRRAKSKRRAKELRRERKVEVLTHYSEGPLACCECGEKRLACLSIDHINGGGNQHRKEVKTDFYHWLRHQGFPSGYRVLCMNCQFVKKGEMGEVHTTAADEGLDEYNADTKFWSQFQVGT